MNPRGLDLVVRTVTTSLLAVGTLALAFYEVAHFGQIDAFVGGFVGLVFGFYFGAHVSMNGASARSRADQLAVAAATGVDPPPDPLARPIRDPNVAD